MRSLVVLATLLVGATSVSAQEIAPTKPIPVREGFYIGFGLGIGQVAYHADFADVDPQSALSGHFRIGGTINQQWRLGAETNGWTKSENGAQAQFGALLATATFYPSPTGNFFLKGGLGFGGYTEKASPDEVSAGGGAGTFGLGYDFRFKGKVGITLVGNFVWTSGWEVEFDGVDLGVDADPSLVQLGVGVIWH